jgi:phosphoglucosamine mutase
LAKKLFGTDGIRGTANQFPITNDIVLRVGQALGYLLRQNKPDGSKTKVLIGKDTRLSGYMIEMALASGLNSMGVHVQLVGPLPTPGIGFLARNMLVDAGIVISASHNQYFDNGIKIFGADGYKISEQMEKEIERLVFSDELNDKLASSSEVGRSRRIDDSMGRYIVYVKNAFPLETSLEGMRIVLDCANGAAYKVAPAIFQELGAEVIVIGDEPNGLNINDKCGALYPGRMAEMVLKYRADLGVSLDGDADRVVMVDENGKLVNGDHILAICALYLKEKNKLKNNTIVCTEMSNFGLRKLMAANQINLAITDVGDKYVVEEMKKNSYVLGGEQSGHIIFLNHTTTGDGLIAALNVIAVMREKKCRLSDLNAVMEDVPQVLVNVRVSKKVPLDQVKGYTALVQNIDDRLKGQGRTFIRYSGTEPLLRILVEGPSLSKIQSYADEIADLLKKELT